MSLWRTLCCCDGQESEDEQHLIDENEENAVLAARRAPIGRSSEAINRLWSTGSSHNSAHGTPVMRNLTPGDEEDELLNQIIESTQQNIIDVANIEGTLVVAGTAEDISKAHRYEDAVKFHDARLRKRTSPSASTHALPGTAVSNPSNVNRTLLCDSAYAGKILMRGPLDTDASHQVRLLAQHFALALTNGVRVEHKQEILVHMSLCDD